jgi:hypothetical protein
MRPHARHTATGVSVIITLKYRFWHPWYPVVIRGREGGRERERGREEGREGGREGGKEGRRGRKGGEREKSSEGGREGGWVGGISEIPVSDEFEGHIRTHSLCVGGQRMSVSVGPRMCLYMCRGGATMCME